MTEPVEPTVRFKDFTLDRPPVKFRIANENFDAVNALSVDLMQQLAAVAAKFDGKNFKITQASELVNSLVDLFNNILEPDSAARFALIARKLDLQEQIIPLLYWLLESYGLRPTEVSSD